MGTARAPVFGSGRCPACSCRVSNPNSWDSSAREDLSVTNACLRCHLLAGPSARLCLLNHWAYSRTGLTQELADHRRLPGFLEQEAVVAVRRLDHLELDRLAERAQRAGDLLGRRRRVQPVRAERDQ